MAMIFIWMNGMVSELKKVRLTKEQARAVEVFKDNNLTLKDYAYENLSEELDPIQILGIDKMARALYVGYEIEPDFKVGDWAECNDGNVGKVTNMRDDGFLTIETIDGFIGAHEKNFRVLTHVEKKKAKEKFTKEKQRRWWPEHGRGVWELKERDLLRQVHDNTKHEVRRMYKDGSVSFVNDSGALSKLSIQSHYKVICFAEDRKDLDD